MAGYVSTKHQEAKEELIVSLRVYIRHAGGIPAAAKKMKMDQHDLAAVLRLDRTVSVSKLQDMGEAIGVKLVMKWEATQ